MDSKDNNGDQPIHCVGKSGCIKLFQLLADNGVKVCSLGHHNNTAMHYAAKFGKFDFIQTALGNGCPVGLRNALNETPLHLAAGYYTRGKFRNHVDRKIQGVKMALKGQK